MKPATDALLQLCLSSQALRFGSFTLKSNRISPYFFNSANLHSAHSLALLAQAYADALTPLSFDILFGPAYKGIPLIAATAVELDRRGKGSVEWCYDRKEQKQHGEGGDLVGASLKHKRIVILDDVITAGTAIRQSIEKIKQHEGILVGIIILLDRQEQGKDTQESAVQQIQREFHVPVLAILTLDGLITYLQDNHASGQDENLESMLQYRKQYGIH